jgi:arginine/ornithine N-succinyltransferase beta subunit
MEKYKPEYLGKVLPDETKAATTFLQDKYEAFNAVYDACKTESANIMDIKTVESSGDSSLSVKVSVSNDQALVNIGENISNMNDENIQISGDVVTADSK